MSGEGTEKPFRFLSNEEFERLSQQEKVSYLAQAIHHLSAHFYGQPTPGITPKRDDPDKSTQEQPER